MNHSKFGTAYTVLVQLEKDGKHYALVSSRSYLKIDLRTEERKWVNDPVTLRLTEARKRYYALWGNTPDLETMGITEIRTKAGNIPLSQRTAFQQFHRMSKVGSSLEFKH
jgi:hypothetical protein